MRRARILAGLASAAMLAGTPAVTAAADGPGAAVAVQFQAFAPAQVDVLPGETVRWENASERTHTVTGDGFASGDLAPGARFEQAFGAAGTFAYRCSIHPVMTGEVDVREVTLDPLPVLPVPAGDRLELTGRTSDPALPVRIERVDGDGAPVGRPVATATPQPDGRWAVSLAATATGDLRAASDRGPSEVRRLLVSDRRVAVRPTRAGVAVSVTPPLPYARIVLQRYRPERFGWWPDLVTRLDYLSEAQIAVPGRGSPSVRVALLDRDGATPLVTSRIVRVRRGRSSPGARPRPTPAGAARGPGRS